MTFVRNNRRQTEIRHNKIGQINNLQLHKQINVEEVLHKECMCVARKLFNYFISKFNVLQRNVKLLYRKLSDFHNVCYKNTAAVSKCGVELLQRIMFPVVRFHS